MAGSSALVFRFLFTLPSVVYFTSLSIAYADDCAAYDGCNCTSLEMGESGAISASSVSCSGPTVNVSATLLRLTEVQANVDAIKMSNVFIERVASTLFSTSTKLTQLHLDENGIRYIDIGAFEALSSLDTLSLENNRIQILDPGALSGLTRLAVLNLAGNELYAVDADLFSHRDVPSLTVLDLRRCRVNDFRLADDLQHLQTVNLADNRLYSFPVFGNGLTSLVEIDLSRNRIQSLDGDVWLPFPGPRTLRLDGNAIEILSNVSIFAWLPSATEKYRLREISLARNRIRTIERASLFGVAQLEELDLTFNQLSRIDAESLPWQSLKKLLVHDNPWDCSSSDGCPNGWLVNNQISVESWNEGFNLSCASPQPLVAKRIYTDRVLDQCRDTALTSSSSDGHTGLYISLVVLVVTACCGVVVCVVVQRRRRRRTDPPNTLTTKSSSHRKGFGTLSSAIGRLKNDPSSSPSRRGAREDDDSWSSSVSYRQMDDLSTPSSNYLDDQNELGI